MTKLAAGFAAAVLPISAQTITTDSEGLEAGDGEIPAYQAKPRSGKSSPAARVAWFEKYGVA